MRNFRLALLLVPLLAALGCSNGMGSRYYNKPEELAVQPVNPPSTQQLITHLNQQATTIKAMEAQDLTITVSEGGLNSYTARGWLFYQKPRSFRLQAEALRSTEADLGSNDNEFWFWFKRNSPPALYHCSYTDYPKVRGLNLPVHPQWVAEALGVEELDPNLPYQLRNHGQNGVELITQVTSPQGQVYYKAVFVSLRPGPMQGRIIQQKLIEPVPNPQGKTTYQEVWVAEVSDYQNIDGYIVPRRMTLKCPKEKLTLDLKLDGCSVNPASLMTKNTQRTFVRPAGYEEVNLGRAAGDNTPANVTKVRGQSPR